MNKLSAPALERAILAADILNRELVDEMIERGRGHQRLDDVRNGLQDDLSIRYLAAIDNAYALYQEAKSRKQYHGTMKPIKRSA